VWGSMRGGSHQLERLKDSGKRYPWVGAPGKGMRWLGAGIVKKKKDEKRTLSCSGIIESLWGGGVGIGNARGEWPRISRMALRGRRFGPDGHREKKDESHFKGVALNYRGGSIRR